MSLFEHNIDDQLKGIEHLTLSLDTQANITSALYQQSIAISLKRIADRLETPIILEYNTLHKDIDNYEFVTDSNQPSDSIFRMMYENRDPKEHSSRDDLK